MKLIHILLILIFLVVSVPAQEIVDLVEEGDFFDIESDENNVVHIFWIRFGEKYYGQIKDNKIVNKETVPGLGYVSSNKFRPRLSVKSDGSEAHLVYTTKDIDPNEVKHAYRDSGGTWHINSAYKADAGRLVQYPSCAVDGDGVVHITFVRYSKTSSTIPVMYVRRAPGSSYQTKEPISPKILKNIWPDIYSDKKGNVHAVWSVSKDTLHYRYAESGGDLTKSKTINLPVREQKNKQPDIFVDEEDNVHIVAMAYQVPGLRVYLDYFMATLPELVFSNPEHASVGLFEIHAEYHSDATIAAKNQDLVYVAWAQGNTNHLIQKVKMSIKKDGEWTKSTLDDDAVMKKTTKPVSTMTRNRVYIVWRSRNKKMKMYTEVIGYGTGITSPADGDNVCGPLVTIEANMDPQSVSSVEFLANGVSIGTSDTEPFTIQWDATEEALGEHSISIKASMTDGSTLEDAITVNLNCPPEISILNLVDGGCVSGTVDLELYAYDDTDDLSRVELYIDNKLKKTMTTAPYTYSWNTSGISSGNHTVQAIAYEGSGQTSSETVTVKTCPVYQPLNLTGEFSLKQTIFFRESSAVLNWESNPSNGSVAEYRVYRILRGHKELALVADPGTFTFKEVVDDSIEVLAYTVTTVDNSGNESPGAFVVLEKVN
ncbi:MAG: Ig-like domain-containing protein [Acidobacteriota bacterium]